MSAKVNEIRLLVSEQEIREAFEWAPDMDRMRTFNKEGRAGKFYAVKALHQGFTDPKNIGHGRRQYTSDELTRSARTLIGRPLNLNHKDALKSGNNVVADAEWNDKKQVIEAIVYIEDPWSQEQIAKGNIKYVSVQGPKPRAIKVLTDGTQIPEGIFFDGLALVTKENTPGDPNSSIRLIEINEAEYPWEDCKADMQAQGHSPESADKICAAIKNRTVQHTIEAGLAKNQSEAIKLISERCKSDPLYMVAISKIAEIGNKMQEARNSSLNPSPDKKASMKIDPASLPVRENLEAFLASLEEVPDMPDPIKMQLAALAKQLYGKMGEVKGEVTKVQADIKSLGAGQQEILKVVKEVQTTIPKFKETLGSESTQTGPLQFSDLLRKGS